LHHLSQNFRCKHVAAAAVRCYAGRAASKNDFAWLRDSSSSRVQRLLKRENAKTKHALARLQPLHQQLVQELENRVCQTEPIAERVGDWLYYSKPTAAGGAQVYYRRPCREDSSSSSSASSNEDTIVLDLNQLAHGGTLGMMKVRSLIALTYCNSEQQPQAAQALSCACILSTASAGTNEVLLFPRANAAALCSIGTTTVHSTNATMLTVVPTDAYCLRSQLSPDHKLLAATIDTTGEDRFQLMLVDIDTNNDSSSSTKKAPGRPAVPYGPPLGDVHSCEWGGETAASEGHYTLYYTVPDALGRPAQVQRVQLQRTAQGLLAVQQQPQLLYAESDSAYFVDVGRTKDHAFMTVHCNSKLSSEVRLLPGKSVNDSAASLKLVRRRQPGVEYYVDHCRGSLYVITNAIGSSSSSSKSTDSAATATVDATTVTGEYRLAVMPVAAVFGGAASSTVHATNTAESVAMGTNSSISCEQEHAGVPWTDVLVPATGARIEDMDMFSQHIALYEAHSSGVPRLRILPLAADGSVAATPSSYSSTNSSSTTGDTSNSPGYYVNFNDSKNSDGESPAVLQPGANQHYDSSTVCFTVSSVLQPAAVYDYDAVQQQLQCLARVSVPGKGANGCANGFWEDFDAAQYVCKRLSAVSADGTAVPITVAHARKCESCTLVLEYGSCSCAAL
jgi:protease II